MAFTNQGWTLTVLSSLLCVLGSFVIYFENVYYFVLPKWFTNRYPVVLERNYTFLTRSMAFSSGGLLITSLYRLLPEAREYFEGDEGLVDNVADDANANSEISLLVAYFGGACFYLAFSHILHILTSESVVHCTHGDDNHSHHPSTHSHSHLEDELFAEAEEEEDSDPNESTPLVQHGLLNLVSHHDSSCKGYSSAELCVFHNQAMAEDLHFCEVPELSMASMEELVPTTTHGSYHSKRDLHHHHVTSAKSRLFLIGIQTTLAITLHKFPEGFITYVTSETDPNLGVSIFLSLLAHNFTEGFTMAMPLYFSFMEAHASFPKLKAVVISSILGGLSQPLGALAGAVFLRYNDAGKFIGSVTDIFGIMFAVTAGFLTVVALQMFGSAVTFSGSLNSSMMWCFIGMAVIAFSGIYVE